jgi:hypothetical protein
MWEIAVGVVVYALIIYLLSFAIRSESLDLFCPAGCKEFGRPQCGDGKGKYYRDGRGDKKDKVATLLDKIEHLSEVDGKTVKWRRSFMLAFFIALLISLLVLKRAPTGPELLLLLFLPFTVIYFGYTFYQQHYYKFVAEFTRENVDIIRGRLKLAKNRTVVI